MSQNWRNIMPTGLELTAGVPVLRRSTGSEASPYCPGIVVWCHEQARVFQPREVEGIGTILERPLSCSVRELMIDLDTDLGFYCALRQLIRIQEEDNTQVDLTTLRRMLTLAKEVTTEASDEDRVALATALARIMATT